MGCGGCGLWAGVTPAWSNESATTKIRSHEPSLFDRKPTMADILLLYCSYNQSNLVLVTDHLPLNKKMRLPCPIVDLMFATSLMTGFLLIPQAQAFSSQSSVLTSNEPVVNGSSDKFDQDNSAMSKPGSVFQSHSNIRIKTLSEWSEAAGNNALRQVQSLASKVAESTAAGDEEDVEMPDHVAGTGGGVFNNESKRARDKSSILRPTSEVTRRSKRQEQVWSALANLELDMQLLDDMAGKQPQLTALELTLLSLSVGAAASGPFIMGGALTEFLAPTSAACT